MFGYTCARLNVRVGRGSFVLAHWLHVSSVTAVSFILTRVEVASGLHLVEAQVGRVTGSRTSVAPSARLSVPRNLNASSTSHAMLWPTQ
jgi:hypothetical protein